MVEQEPQKPSRRMGPVGFSAQKKVTTYKGPSGKASASGSDSGGSDPVGGAGSQRSLGQASGPTLETPTKSKELRVMPLWVWYAVAFAVALVGVVFVVPAVIVVGLLGAVAVYFVGRANRTEARLRSEFFEPEEG